MKLTTGAFATLSARRQIGHSMARPTSAGGNGRIPSIGRRYELMGEDAKERD
jgi:hypothetical protein